MARKFFFVCAGMFLLALSYYFGASTATAQQGTPVVGFTESGFTFFVLTPNGDVYRREYDPWSNAGPTYVGNFWSGAPTPALHQSWGQVKARYRATPGITVVPGSDSR